MIPGASFATAALRPSVLGRLHPVVRLGGLGLGLASSMLAGPLALGVMAAALVWFLERTGLGLSRQLAVLRPWAWAGALVLLIHTFTSTWAAPLWHPSAGGMLAGVEALARVACSIGWLGLYLRTSSLDDLVLGVCWWLRPLTRIGLPTENLGLVLAVALGTAPGVLGEGRRKETVVRLRRTGPGGAAGAAGSRNPLRRLLFSLVDRARVVIPLLETLARRAETLSLSLRTRRPVEPEGVQGPPVGQLAVLALWLIGVVWFGAGGPEAGMDWGLR